MSERRMNICRSEVNEHWIESLVKEGLKRLVSVEPDSEAGVSGAHGRYLGDGAFG